MAPTFDIFDIIRDITRLMRGMSLNQQIVYEVPSCHYCNPGTRTINKHELSVCASIIDAYKVQDLCLKYPNINIIITRIDGIKVHLYRK